jgi:hypothetical protein
MGADPEGDIAGGEVTPIKLSVVIPGRASARTRNPCG